jgi:hypothetical protein
LFNHGLALALQKANQDAIDLAAELADEITSDTTEKSEESDTSEKSDLSDFSDDEDEKVKPSYSVQAGLHHGIDFQNLTIEQQGDILEQTFQDYFRENYPYGPTSLPQSPEFPEITGDENRVPLNDPYEYVVTIIKRPGQANLYIYNIPVILRPQNQPVSMKDPSKKASYKPSSRCSKMTTILKKNE